MSDTNKPKKRWLPFHFGIPLAEGETPMVQKGGVCHSTYSALEAVVFCRDCKWRNTKACFCKKPKDVQDKWFCSEGEVKTDA